MNNEIICIIPCREGSERLKGKNKRELLGIPLYERTLKQAIECKFFDVIYVTSDDLEILNGCHPYEIEDIRVKTIERPEALAGPDTPMWAVVDHCCQGHPDDSIIVLLQVTSPLRTVQDIKNAFKMFEKFKGQIGLFSAGYNFEDHIIKLNGAIFIHYLRTIRNTKSFIHTVSLIYLMPPERSVDIDTYEDFEDAESIMKEKEGLE